MTPILLRLTPMVLAAALLAGCGSTRVVREANDVAEAGKAYATAMDALAVYILDKQIEGDYDMLAGHRRSERKDPKHYEDRLAKATDDAVEYAKKIGIYREHTRKLGEYFDELNALVDANVKDAGVAGAKKAAEGLNALGSALQSSLHITAAQVTALSAVGGIVFTEMHGAAVKRHLEEYGPLIARQLAIQDLALQVFAKDLRRIQNKDQSDVYLADLRPAYLKDADKGAARPALSADFKAKWASYVKEPAVAAQLATADAAARKMQKAWRSYLEGKGNMADMVAESEKLLAVAEQASALHKNRHKPASATQ